MGMKVFVSYKHSDSSVKNFTELVLIVSVFLILRCY
jgi:hypothetical protein